MIERGMNCIFTIAAGSSILTAVTKLPEVLGNVWDKGKWVLLGVLLTELFDVFLSIRRIHKYRRKKK